MILSERKNCERKNYFFPAGQAGANHSIPFVLGIVVGETIETYRDFGIFCEKHGVISKVDKRTNFLWTDMDKGLDVEVPRHFKEIIHCFCQIHQERALSKEFGKSFNVTAFRNLCKAVSAEQVSDALDQIGNRCQKARSKIEGWGLEKFVLHKLVEANPDTWTAGVRNSNLVERVMYEMLGYGDDNGRGVMFAHMFLRSHVFALTCFCAHMVLRSHLVFCGVWQRAL